ncbi:hypothetical protein ACIRQP_34235 [Streptomyces sp. NPDC102274]|uniref:hypothetical protein n=1 Tax=Streptomyces sp. NPDC102274 TaxID=3366151 RepID=UPI003810FAEA
MPNVIRVIEHHHTHIEKTETVNVPVLFEAAPQETDLVAPESTDAAESPPGTKGGYFLE